MKNKAPPQRAVLKRAESTSTYSITRRRVATAPAKIRQTGPTSSVQRQGKKRPSDSKQRTSTKKAKKSHIRKNVEHVPFREMDQRWWKDMCCKVSWLKNLQLEDHVQGEIPLSHLFIANSLVPVELRTFLSDLDIRSRVLSKILLLARQNSDIVQTVQGEKQENPKDFFFTEDQSESLAVTDDEVIQHQSDLAHALKVIRAFIRDTLHLCKDSCPLVSRGDRSVETQSLLSLIQSLKDDDIQCVGRFLDKNANFSFLSLLSMAISCFIFNFIFRSGRGESLQVCSCFETHS